MRRFYRKRMLLTLLLLLTGGAIINVTVAWTCALIVDVESGTFGRQSDRRWPQTTWNQNVSQDRLGHKRTKWEHVELDEPFVVEGGSIRPRTRTLAYWWVDESGWPMRAMSSRKDNSGTWGGIELQLNSDWRVLSFVPIWPGFAINTIFYAAILWLLFAAPRMPGFVRRRIRARRGQCPACAYPIGTSNVCTECGKRVTPMA